MAGQIFFGHLSHLQMPLSGGRILLHQPYSPPFHDRFNIIINHFEKTFTIRKYYPILKILRYNTDFKKDIQIRFIPTFLRTLETPKLFFRYGVICITRRSHASLYFYGDCP